MQQRLRVRQLAHQGAGAAGVVEMHVRQQQVVDGCARHAELVERGEQVRYRVVGADIDERRAPGVDDDMRRGVTCVQVFDIDRGDAVRMPVQSRRHGNIGARCVSVAVAHVHILTKYASLDT